MSTTVPQDPAISVADALFGKTRQAVLALLFGAPGRAHYTREILQFAQSGASQVQRELDQLTRSGLIVREPRGNQVWYRANPKAAVFAELVGLVAKTFGVADVIREALHPWAGSIGVALVYGSVARGEQVAENDVDVLIVGDLMLADLDAPLRTAEDKLGRHVALTLLDARDYAKRRKADDQFLAAVMGGPKIFLAGDEAQLRTLESRHAR